MKNGRKSFSKTIVICFLKVQNEWVVLKNDSFFPKKKRSFLKTIEKRNKKRSFNNRFQKRLTTLALMPWRGRAPQTNQSEQHLISSN